MVTPVPMTDADRHALIQEVLAVPMDGYEDHPFFAEVHPEEKGIDEDVEIKAPVITPGGRVGDNASLNTSPKENWVEERGGLPEYIRTVRNGLIKDGKTESAATALAIAAVKRWARGGGNVSKPVQAAAAEALAKWEAMKSTKSEGVEETMEYKQITMDEFREMETKARVEDGNSVGHPVSMVQSAGSSHATAAKKPDPKKAAAAKARKDAAAKKKADSAKRRAARKAETAKKRAARQKASLAKKQAREKQSATKKAANAKQREARKKAAIAKKQAAAKKRAAAGGKKKSGGSGSSGSSGGAQKRVGRSGGGSGSGSNSDFESKHPRDQFGRFAAIQQGDGTKKPADKEKTQKIKSVQNALIKAGLLDAHSGDKGSSGEDGKFGPKTAAAVKSWQKKNGMKPDGLLSNETIAQMVGGKKPKKAAAKVAGKGKKDSDVVIEIKSQLIGIFNADGSDDLDDTEDTDEAFNEYDYDGDLFTDEDIDSVEVLDEGARTMHLDDGRDISIAANKPMEFKQPELPIFNKVINPTQKKILERVHTAMEAKDYQEAERMANQLRVDGQANGMRENGVKDVIEFIDALRAL